MITLRRLVVVTIMLLCVSYSVMAQAQQVNCDSGQTITQALATAQPGDTLLVTGICREQVRMTTDRIVLDGQGSAVIEGNLGVGNALGQITIDGAQGIVLTGLTVQNSRSNGIVGRRNTAFTVNNVTVQNSANNGILVSETSSAIISDCMALNNAQSGIAISTGSSVVFPTGSVQSTSNGDDGLSVVVGSSALVVGPGASLTMSNNQSDGILVGSSTLQIVDPTVVLTTTNNGENGIFLFGGGMGMLGGTLSSENNAAAGIRVISTGLGLQPGTTVSLSNNVGAGLVAQLSANVVVSGTPDTPHTITGNGTNGIEVDDSSIFLTSVTIQNNAVTDALLAFGTRATLLDSTVGSVTCDPTVMIRGAMCQ